jgi:hypothetical protein
MEVTLFVPQGQNLEDFLLGAEARFGTMTICSDDLEQNVEFGVSSAVLRLILAGCKIAPGERLGDTAATTVRTKVHQQKVSNRKIARGVKVSGQASGTLSETADAKVGASLGGAFEKSIGVEEKEVRTTDFEVSRSPIMPQSGDRWVFQAINEPVLMARRSGDDHLCKIEVQAEQITITAQLYFYPKHIVLLEGELTGSIPLYSKLKASKTKAAIAKTLLRRQMAEKQDAYNSLNGGVLGYTFRLSGAVDEPK